MQEGPFVEAVVGFHRDSVFGHVCTFGLGGVSIELFKDVSRRLLPLTPASEPPHLPQPPPLPPELVIL